MSRKLKLLVVEDEEMVRDVVPLLVQFALKNLGFEKSEFVVAGNPDEALAAIEAAKDSPFDLVLSDIQCDPKNNQKAGFDIVAHATNMMPKCIALMMTGLEVNNNLLVEVLESGAKDCIKKPIMLDDLQAKLKQYFKK